MKKKEKIYLKKWKWKFKGIHKRWKNMKNSIFYIVIVKKNYSQVYFILSIIKWDREFYGWWF